VLDLDAQRRGLLTDLEGKRAEQNRATKEIGELKKAKKDASGPVEAMRLLGQEIKALQDKTRDVEAAIRDAHVR